MATAVTALVSVIATAKGDTPQQCDDLPLNQTIRSKPTPLINAELQPDGFHTANDPWSSQSTVK